MREKLLFWRVGGWWSHLLVCSTAKGGSFSNDLFSYTWNAMVLDHKLGIRSQNDTTSYMYFFSETISDRLHYSNSFSPIWLEIEKLLYIEVSQCMDQQEQPSGHMLLWFARSCSTSYLVIRSWSRHRLSFCSDSDLFFAGGVCCSWLKKIQDLLLFRFPRINRVA